MLTFFRRLWFALRRSRHDADLREEIEAHRQMRQERLEREGMTPEEAGKGSRRAIGNVTLAREDARAMWVWPWLDSLGQDMRHAARSLTTHPGFTVPITVVLFVTMLLAITAFGFMDTLLFRPWPLPDASSLVVVRSEFPVGQAVVFGASPALYQSLKEQVRSVNLVAWHTVQLPIGTAEPSTRPGRFVRFVSGNYFPVLGLPLVLGRGLSPADDSAGGSSEAAVISYAVWRDQLAASPDAIGAHLLVDNRSFTVVGVAAAGATDNPFVPAPDAWLTLASRRALWATDPSVRQMFEGPHGCCVELAGRLNHGTTVAVARQELKQVADRFGAGYGMAPTRLVVSGTAGAAQPSVWERARAPMAVIALTVLLVVILGCANVGNLQLARGLMRRREIAIRFALGATRPRVVRLLLMEAGAVSLAAMGLALLVAPILLGYLLRNFDGRATLVVAWRVTPTVFFSLGLAVVCAAASALVPAVRVTGLAQSARVRGGPFRLRLMLLATQIAVSTVLLVGAALLARGVYQVAVTDLGFNPYGVVALRVGLPEATSAPEEWQTLTAILDATEAAGLGPVAASASVPFGGYQTSDQIRTAHAAAAGPRRAVTHRVTGGYFSALQIPFKAGGVFDGRSSTDVVVNERLARLLWPGDEALGKTFVDGTEKHVVGVVADAHTELLDAVSPTYYQRADAASNVLVRTDAAGVRRFREILGRIAPRASLEVAPLVPGLLRQLNPMLVSTVLASAIALVALLLAAIGTFGVFSYLVNERTQEIGVRLALGAARHDIVRTLMAGLLRPLAVGVVVGGLLAQSLGVVLSRYLHGISVRDPLAYVVVMSVLVGAATIALIGPARRAFRVEPAVTLRAD
jgi:predicted permease